jgi:serine phosphatase RsbU (regulator of sigma subunit)
VWDPRDGSLRVATAGHPHLLACHDGSVTEIGCLGPPLGSALASRDLEAVVHCPPGTVFVAYTDGVAEAASPAGDPLGYDCWPQHLPGVANMPEATDILEQLLATVDVHCDGRPKEDDVTVLVAKVLG